MNDTFQVYAKRVILTCLTLVVIAVIFFLTFEITKPFLGILATAGIFAIFLNPLYQKLNSLKLKKGMAALLTIVLLLVFLVIPLALLASSLFSEALRVTRTIQSDSQYINSLQSDIEARIQALQIPIEFGDLDLNQQIYQGLTFLTKNIGTIVVRSGGILLNLFFTLITIYFFLTNQKKITSYLENLNFFPKKYLKLISSRTVEIVNGTVRGYLLVVVLQLIVGVAGFLIFKIPAAVLLGSLYGVSSLLPVVGGFMVWIPVVIWQFSIGNTLTAFLLVAWFVLLSFLIESVISPKIIGQNTKLHQLFIMFSVFGGLQYFGLLGMVLGPVIIALAFVALSILREIVSTDTTKKVDTA